MCTFLIPGVADAPILREFLQFPHWTPNSQVCTPFWVSGSVGDDDLWYHYIAWVLHFFSLSFYFFLSPSPPPGGPPIWLWGPPSWHRGPPSWLWGPPSRLWGPPSWLQSSPSLILGPPSAAASSEALLACSEALPTGSKPPYCQTNFITYIKETN